MQPQYRPNSASAPIKFSAPATYRPSRFGQHQRHIVAQPVLRDVEKRAASDRACPICARRCPDKTPRTHPSVRAGSDPPSGSRSYRQMPAPAPVPCGCSCACAMTMWPGNHQSWRNRGSASETAALSAPSGPDRARRRASSSRAKGHVQRRNPVVFRQLHRPLHQRRKARLFKSGPDQKPPPRCGRVRHGDLQLRIVSPARAFISMGPVVIKDIFALRMGFQRTSAHRRSTALGHRPSGNAAAIRFRCPPNRCLPVL